MKICPCCMEEHEAKIITVTQHSVFKGVPVEFDAEFHYCEWADETYADEQQISANDTAMKNAYRSKSGLLTSGQIAAIRARYGISQSDLCLLLGWGGKTITRYESHQVQDAAHDTILRKLGADPEWFLQLLNTEKESLSPASYEKYFKAGTVLFERDRDHYLRSAILANYARYFHDSEASGNQELSLDVVADMIRYYANSVSVTNLYLVKLQKLLWYADMLSYKRRRHAISGMAYRALPMGAVPVACESIIDLSTVCYEEIEMGDGTGYRFLPTDDMEYSYLTPDDREILDFIICRFGKSSRNEIVERMHKEDAYIKTAPHDIIQFKYAKTLSLS